MFLFQESQIKKPVPIDAQIKGFDAQIKAIDRKMADFQKKASKLGKGFDAFSREYMGKLAKERDALQGKKSLAETEKFIDSWIREAKVAPEIARAAKDNFIWFIKTTNEMKGGADKRQIGTLYSIFSDGIPDNKAALLTLNDALGLLKMRSEHGGLDYLDPKTFYNALVYANGSPNGPERMICGSWKTKPLKVSTIFKLASADLSKHAAILDAMNSMPPATATFNEIMEKLESDFNSGIALSDRALNGWNGWQNTAVNEGVMGTLQMFFLASYDSWMLHHSNYSDEAAKFYGNSGVARMHKKVSETRASFLRLKGAYEGDGEGIGLKKALNRHDYANVAKELDRFIDAFSIYVAGLQQLTIDLAKYDPKGAEAWVKSGLFIADWISTGAIVGGLFGNIGKYAFKKAGGEVIEKATQEVAAKGAEEAVAKEIKYKLLRNISKSIWTRVKPYAIPAGSGAVGASAQFLLVRPATLDRIEESLRLFENDQTRGKAIEALKGILENLSEDPYVAKELAKNQGLRDLIGGAGKKLDSLSILLAGRSAGRGTLQRREMRNEDIESDLNHIAITVILIELACMGLKKYGAPTFKLPKR